MARDFQEAQFTATASEGCNNGGNRVPRRGCTLYSSSYDGKGGKTSSSGMETLPSTLPLSDGLSLIELCCFSGMKKPLVVALDCEMGNRAKRIFGKHREEAIGISWDSKHHNWSGHSVSETGIQMRGPQAEPYKPAKFPDLLSCCSWKVLCKFCIFLAKLSGSSLTSSLMASIFPYHRLHQ